MNILGGYGSDDSSSGDEKVSKVVEKNKPTAAGPAPPPKKVVDFSKLQGCLQRPLQLDAEEKVDDEAPLAKKAKTLQPYKAPSKRFIDRLPAPQMEPVSLGATKNKGRILAAPVGQKAASLGEVDQHSAPQKLPNAFGEDKESSDSDDDEDVGDGSMFTIGQDNDPAFALPPPQAAELPQVTELPGINSAPDQNVEAMMFAPGPRLEPARAQAASQPVVSHDSVPENLWNHPMFQGNDKNGRKRPVDGFTPSEHEVQMMQSAGLSSIHHDQMTNPDWYRDNQLQKGRMGIKGEKVNFECSLYDVDKWATTNHANPTKTQKRKHQINWLAHDAMEKEAEMLERAAQGKERKNNTYLKYGW